MHLLKKDFLGVNTCKTNGQWPVIILVHFVSSEVSINQGKQIKVILKSVLCDYKNFVDS